MEGGPENKVNLADICKEGKIVIFGVPGAFTTPCSKTHLPGSLCVFKFQNKFVIFRVMSFISSAACYS